MELTMVVLFPLLVWIMENAGFLFSQVIGFISNNPAEMVLGITVWFIIGLGTLLAMQRRNYCVAGLPCCKRWNCRFYQKTLVVLGGAFSLPMFFVSICEICRS